MKYTTDIRVVLDNPRPLIVIDERICDPWQVPQKLVKLLQWTAPAYVIPHTALMRIYQIPKSEIKAELHSLLNVMGRTAAIIQDDQYFSLIAHSQSSKNTKSPLSNLETYISNQIVAHFPHLINVREETSALDGMLDVQFKIIATLNKNKAYKTIMGVTK